MPGPNGAGIGASSAADFGLGIQGDDTLGTQQSHKPLIFLKKEVSLRIDLAHERKLGVRTAIAHI